MFLHVAEGPGAATRGPSASMLATVEDTRSAYSLQRLARLTERLQDAEQLLSGHPLSVYVTGSYGRHEAWSDSDLDVFFLHGRSEDDGPFPYIAFIELSAEL